jgi:hypothetical protein
MLVETVLAPAPLLARVDGILRNSMKDNAIIATNVLHFVV